MRKGFRILGVLVIATAVLVWLGTGAKIGWTTTEEAVKTMDPVTQIEGISYAKRFRAGVDFLGAALVGGVVLVGVSLLFRQKPNQ